MKTLLLALLISLSVFAQTAKVSWDANIESDLAGYKLYYGTSSGSYDIELDVGDTTSFVVPLVDGITYFFAVTAYDDSSNESAFSDEVIFPDNRPPGTWNIVFGDREIQDKEIVLEIIPHGDEMASGNGWTIWGHGKGTDSGLYILNPNGFTIRIMFDVKLIGDGICIEQSRMLDVAGNPRLIDTSWQEVDITSNKNVIFINYADDCFIEGESDANVRVENLKIWR